MLYYLKVEVLGDATSEGLEGISARYRTANVLSCHKKGILIRPIHVVLSFIVNLRYRYLTSTT